MGRIEDTFAQLKTEGRTGLIAYLTVGYPDVASTLELAPAIVEDSDIVASRRRLRILGG